MTPHWLRQVTCSCFCWPPPQDQWSSNDRCLDWSPWLRKKEPRSSYITKTKTYRASVKPNEKHTENRMKIVWSSLVVSYWNTHKKEFGWIWTLMKPHKKWGLNFAILCHTLLSVAPLPRVWPCFDRTLLTNQLDPWGPQGSSSQVYWRSVSQIAANPNPPWDPRLVHQHHPCPPQNCMISV